jgi:outer membrane protein OmpA-like peptidoglycan-associated protein
MSVGRKHFSTTIGTITVSLLLASMLGCRPPAPTAPPPLPPPQPVVVTQPVQPVAQPAYRPTTEEWVQLPVRLSYPTGGSRISDENRAMLREAHATLANRTDIVRIRVEGHADSRGTEEQNQRLSEERAQAVVDYLVGDLGLPRELFETQGFGSTRPITSETTASDRVQNRRVEFSILVRRQAAP